MTWCIRKLVDYRPVRVRAPSISRCTRRAGASQTRFKWLHELFTPSTNNFSSSFAAYQDNMAGRTHAGPMDFEYQNGTGPLDERSPFAQVSRNSQRNNSSSSSMNNEKKRKDDSKQDSIT